MNLKKALSLLMAMCMIIGILGGCGKSDSGESTADSSVETTTQETSTEETTQETTTEETTQETTVEETTQETTRQEPTNPPAPTVKYDPVPLSGALPENGRVSGSFFDDAVFVGDSVSLKLSYYEASVNKLGTAQFLTSGSLGSGNALWAVSSESVHPSYQGTKMLIEEAVAKTGAKKLYIMLGMNDIAMYGIDGSVSNMVTLINRILAASPGLTVYVQSMTPISSTSNILSSSGHNPKNIQRYNEALLGATLQNGWNFVNVSEVMYDSNGYLRSDYCSDSSGMGIHFTNAGCEAWIEYLYTHTAG